MSPIVIFTDLDGSLLDAKTYSFDAAGEALNALRVRNVPLILVSSKTRAEIERLRNTLDHPHPFVSENGGGVFIPKGYFDFPLEGAVLRGPYQVIELGLPYGALRLALKEIAHSLVCRLRGCGAPSPSKRTGSRLWGSRAARGVRIAQVFLHHFGVHLSYAIGADSVREFDCELPRKVRLQVIPHSRLIANFLAGGADRKKSESRVGMVPDQKMEQAQTRRQPDGQQGQRTIDDGHADGGRVRGKRQPDDRQRGTDTRDHDHLGFPPSGPESDQQDGRDIQYTHRVTELTQEIQAKHDTGQHGCRQKL